MAVAQVIAPDSKLAIARGLRGQTAASSLGEVLHLGSCDEDDLYAAMDYLHGRQDAIQDALAARHLAGGTLVLYDVSSAAFEGRTCPLGAIGHPKDGVRGRLQIVYGLLTSKEGIPVAIEVFKGNTGDPVTVAAQVTKVKDRFGITTVVLVGDRGMLTAARLREDVRPAKLDWITALRAPQVKALVRDGDLQLTLFDQADLAEITSPDFPGERLVACKNPFLEAERARKRESLLAATEADLAKIAAACARARAPLRGQDKIAVRADRVLSRRKVAKHFTVEITGDSIRYSRDQDSIAAEAALDGIYVLRTSVAATDLDSPQVVSSYKALAQVERAFEPPPLAAGAAEAEAEAGQGERARCSQPGMLPQVVDDDRVRLLAETARSAGGARHLGEGAGVLADRDVGEGRVTAELVGVDHEVVGGYRGRSDASA